MEKESETRIYSKLDNIFKVRYHGASNIRGIRYQILYSTLKAFDLFEKNCDFQEIIPEGIEDVDLVGITAGNEYIQVKYSKEPWSWSKLKDPLKNFLDVYKESSENRFALVVNFELKKDIKRLTQLNILPKKDQKRVEKKFRNLCCDAGFTTDDFSGFLKKIQIISLPEEIIWRNLQNKMVETFNMSGDGVDSSIMAFIAKFLEWASIRRAVMAVDLKELYESICEGWAREKEFKAYGKGLIEHLTWSPDENVIDFFEGKKTRPGHIKNGLDIRRPKWLDRIALTLKTFYICILRSSSGQGKSTLMYRYVFENWLEENVFLLKIAKNPEHVEMIINYLKFKANFGIPTLLLIDNIGWKTNLWYSIAHECALHKIKVLVTIRHEDWYRYSYREMTGYEIIEPLLDIDEAKNIFDIFNEKNRIHKSVISPEWAFEKIGEPHLLMEYVYLITHGQMLAERLRDQVREIHKKKEDPAKIDILRKISVSDTVGSELEIGKIKSAIATRDDLQQILKSLLDEYISIEKGFVSGLHWVRSNHLLKILHEDYLNPSYTVLEVIDIIPESNISRCIANAFNIADIDSEKLLEGLIEKSRTLTLKNFLAYLDGLFEAGEKFCLNLNKNCFDEAFDLLGKEGISLLATNFTPRSDLHIIDDLAKISVESDNPKKLKEISSKIILENRGLDLCKKFLTKTTWQIKPGLLKNDFRNTGLLLDWCHLCGVEIPVWDDVRDNFINSSKIFEIQLDDFCMFSQGFYRYDTDYHLEWFSKEKANIISYFKLYLDCIDIELSDESIRIEFFPDHESEIHLNDQSVMRLQKLRNALPFFKRYQSQGIWILPFGLTPSVDNTTKNIPIENIHSETDVQKNVVWKEIVESHYLPDSFYEFQESWFELRKDILYYFKEFNKGLIDFFEGKHPTFNSSINNRGLTARITKNLNILPGLPPQCPKNIVNSFKEGPTQWKCYFYAFLSKLYKYFSNPKETDDNTTGIMLQNLRDVNKHLPKLHETFDKLFDIVTDYFNAHKLVKDELKNYSLLVDLFEVIFVNPIRDFQNDILKYIEDVKEIKRKYLIQKMKETFFPLENKGIKIIIPSDCFYENYLRYLPIAYSVNNKFDPTEEFFDIIERLYEFKDDVIGFWLIPTIDNKRFMKGGYTISSYRIDQIKKGDFDSWEILAPVELPKGILQLLPGIPLEIDEKFEIRLLIIRVIISSNSLKEQNSKIEKLKNAENRFELELYERQMKRINNLMLSITNDLDKAKNELKILLGDLTENLIYYSFFRYLHNLRDILTSGNIEEYEEWVELNGDKYLESFDDLLEIIPS